MMTMIHPVHHGSNRRVLPYTYSLLAAAAVWLRWTSSSTANGFSASSAAAAATLFPGTTGGGGPPLLPRFHVQQQQLHRRHSMTFHRPMSLSSPPNKLWIGQQSYCQHPSKLLLRPPSSSSTRLFLFKPSSSSSSPAAAAAASVVDVLLLRGGGGGGSHNFSSSSSSTSWIQELADAISASKTKCWILLVISIALEAVATSMSKQAHDIQSLPLFVAACVLYLAWYVLA